MSEEHQRIEIHVKPAEHGGVFYVLCSKFVVVVILFTRLAANNFRIEKVPLTYISSAYHESVIKM